MGVQVAGTSSRAGTAIEYSADGGSAHQRDGRRCRKQGRPVPSRLPSQRRSGEAQPPEAGSERTRLGLGPQIRELDGTQARKATRISGHTSWQGRGRKRDARRRRHHRCRSSGAPAHLQPRRRAPCAPGRPWSSSASGSARQLWQGLRRSRRPAAGRGRRWRRAAPCWAVWSALLGEEIKLNADKRRPVPYKGLKACCAKPDACWRPLSCRRSLHAGVAGTHRVARHGPLEPLPQLAGMLGEASCSKLLRARCQTLPELITRQQQPAGGERRRSLWNATARAAGMQAAQVSTYMGRCDSLREMHGWC